MITREQVIPCILAACPSFQDVWRASDDQDLLYVVMGDLARHLLVLHQAGQVEEFGTLCECIERFCVEGDPYVSELAVIGFLEGVQNNWAHNNANPEDFAKFLLPESKEWWKELNDFWAGKIAYVGAGLQARSKNANGADPGLFLNPEP